MDMGIVNAGGMPIMDDLPTDLREAVEDVVLNRNSEATERLIAIADRSKGSKRKEDAKRDEAWRELPIKERLQHALVHGNDSFIEADTELARASLDSPSRRDRRPVDGRHERGR